MNSDFIEKESLEFVQQLDSTFPSENLKKEYFEYTNHHIIYVLLILAKDFRGISKGDVFNYMEEINDNRCLFHFRVFEKLAVCIEFIDRKFWSEIIEVYHQAFNKFPPKCLDTIIKGNQGWGEIRNKSNVLIKNIGLDKIDPFEYADNFIDHEILLRMKNL